MFCKKKSDSKSWGDNLILCSPYQKVGGDMSPMSPLVTPLGVSKSFFAQKLQKYFNDKEC